MLKGETAGGVPVTSADTRRPAHKRIDTLDSYRALAILTVLAYHYTVRWAPPEDPRQHLASGAIFDGFTALHYGIFGVEFFFMISGFVILMTLERCRNLGDFILRRFARLWPALVVSVTLSTAVVAWLGPEDWAASPFDYLTSIALIDPSVASWFTHWPGIKWVDGSYWSLWTELGFYAWASAIYLLARTRFVIAWLALFAFLMVGVALSHWQMPSFILHSPIAFPVRALVVLWAYRIPSYLFLPHFPYFTVGVCAYEIWSNGRFKNASVAGIVLAAALVLYRAATRHSMYAEMDPIDTSIINLVIFGLFLLFTFGHPLAELFARKPLVAVGQASYSLYLLHQNIGIAIMRRGIALGIPYLVILPMTVLAMIGLAFSVFRLVEIPAKAWFLRGSAGLVKAIDRLMPALSYKNF